jgi:low temperature requirement protein LtrA
MKGISVPPLTEDFTADPVELFFDLAYVFAFSQLVGLLIHDPTWGGVGSAALLFLILWLPWQQLTWSANAVSGNGRQIRIIFLLATVLSVPMAAATSSAFTSGGLVFSVALSGIVSLGFFIQLMATKDAVNMTSAVVRWITPNLVSIALLIAGGLVEGRLRVWFWLAALVVVITAMVMAGSGEWMVRVGHFAERHGLIVIIALGEVIVAIGLPVVAALQEGEGLGGWTIAALVASGMFAALLWWAYFDRPSPGLEHGASLIETEVLRGRYVRDVYTWAHAPVVAGIILAAAALEEIALHPEAHVELAFRGMLGGGLALSVAGVAIAVWRSYRAVAIERLVAGAFIIGLVAMGGSFNGVVLLSLVVAVIFFALVTEHARVEQSKTV